MAVYSVAMCMFSVHTCPDARCCTAHQTRPPMTLRPVLSAVSPHAASRRPASRQAFRQCGHQRPMFFGKQRACRPMAFSAPSAAGCPDGVQLRDGRPEDLKTVADAVFAEKMNPIGLDMGRFVVAEELASGRVVGFGQLKDWPMLSAKKDLRGQIVRAAGLWPNWRGELVELGSLVVVPDWRGRGVGSAVVSELVRKAAGKTLCLITIGSSVPFYERLGFIEIPQQAVPRPLKPEVALGSVVARLAVNDRVLCMAHKSAIDGGMLPGENQVPSSM